MDLDRRIAAALPPVPERWPDTGLRTAAVLVPILLRDGEDHVLFTQRPDDLPAHGGQIAFPGGMQQGAETPLQCALREAREEVGAGDVEAVFGALPSRRSSSQVLVQPVVARLPAGQTFTMNEREVRKLLFVPWRLLDDAGNWRQLVRPRPDGGSYPPSPHFDWHGDWIWGLTGRIMADLLESLRAAGR